MSANVVSAQGGAVPASPAVAAKQAIVSAPETTISLPKPELNELEAVKQQVIEQEHEEPERKKVILATEQLNDVISAFDKGIRFRLYEGTDQLYVQIVDRKSDEVIRSIPSKEMLEHMARLHEVLGMIMDTEG